MPALKQHLEQFFLTHKPFLKGKLSAVLVLTRNAKTIEPPYKEKDLITKGAGQVKGLGGSAVKKILSEHGITRQLTAEGGRTSRGNMQLMQDYVELLNNLADLHLLKFEEMEAFWAQKVREYFASQPLRLRMDQSKSSRHLVKNLLAEAEKRQSECPGTMIVGALMEHLVGAKIEAMLGVKVDHKCFSVADESTGAKGDFLIGDTSVHVTNHPSEQLILKCSANLAQNLRPLIVTGEKGVAVACGLADTAGIEERIDVLEIGQFMATNVYEKSKFVQKMRAITFGEIITVYNRVVDECETDPSLRIEID